MAGWWLVFAQFALIALLLWPSSTLHFSIAGAILLGLALLLGIWTLTHNRPGNFNIHPHPKVRGRLIKSGPYEYVRHPMYVALLIFAAALCFLYRDAWKLPVWLLLAVVLWIKSKVEERALRARYADYAGYAQRVRRFIPRWF